MPSAANLQLSTDRVLRPAVWERTVRAALRRYTTLYEAAEALEVHRETLRRWCDSLGIEQKAPGPKKRLRKA